MNEFDIKLSENEIKVLPASIFKKIVKNKAVSAGIEYLKTKQMKCEKGVRIKYSTLELQDYLKPCSNLQLQEQQYIFSLRSEMNPLKKNFERNTKMKQEFCIKSCKQELDNEHITWCNKMNVGSDLKFEHLLNGTLQEKIQTMKQIKLNEKIRNSERVPCDPNL